MDSDISHDLILFGAGGFTKQVLMTINHINRISKKFNLIGILDDDETLWNTTIDGIPILGGLDWFETNYSEHIQCMITISDPKTRHSIVEKLQKYSIHYATIIHPSVILDNSCVLGEGAIVQAGTIIEKDVKIGNHCHVNSLCFIAHETILHDFVTLSPSSIINGVNIIETGVFVGSSTTTIEDIVLKEWSKTGAGTVMLSNSEPHSLYVGTPGKLIKKLS